jgi:hypothetical protein
LEPRTRSARWRLQGNELNQRKTNRPMSRKLNNVAGGIATSFATKTLLVAKVNANQTTLTVHSQQTQTVNTYRATSIVRTFASARKTHHLLRLK